METRYPAVGECIYCGAADKELSDEHTVALALNGTFVLPKASCSDCARITGSFEGKVLRGFALEARTALGFKTRRPKNVPKSFRLSITRAGKEEVIHVAIEDHAVVLPLPLYPMPGCFNEKLGKPAYSGGIGLTGIVTVWLSDREEVRKKFDADEISVESVVDHISFAKMLAKIGFCHAVAKFGRDAMAEVYVLPAILGERDDIGKWVGSIDKVADPEPGVGHQIFVETWHPSSGCRDTIVVAYIRLFSHLPSCMYTVIVGGPKGAAWIQAINARS